MEWASSPWPIFLFILSNAYALWRLVWQNENWKLERIWKMKVKYGWDTTLFTEYFQTNKNNNKSQLLHRNISLTTIWTIYTVRRHINACKTPRYELMRPRNSRLIHEILLFLRKEFSAWLYRFSTELLFDTSPHVGNYLTFIFTCKEYCRLQTWEPSQAAHTNWLRVKPDDGAFEVTSGHDSGIFGNDPYWWVWVGCSCASSYQSTCKITPALN